MGKRSAKKAELDEVGKFLAVNLIHLYNSSESGEIVDVKRQKAIQSLEENDPTVDEPVWCLKKAQMEKPTRQCPYLDTIDR
jgi:hypothetical protein